MDFFRVLGITRYASEDEAKQAYRAKVRATHPDTSGNPSSGIEFIKIQQAWEYIKSKGFNNKQPEPKSRPKPKPQPKEEKRTDFEEFKAKEKPKSTEKPTYERRYATPSSVTTKSRYEWRANYTDEDLAWIALAINNLRRDAASVVITDGYIFTGRSASAASSILKELREISFPADEDEDAQVSLLKSLKHSEMANLLDNLITLSNAFSSVRDSFLFEYYLSKKHKKVN